jgi:crotonobetainyl-CoA:carnitine CoA-transferase CaiB-like acyl-CoA transferase
MPELAADPQALAAGIFPTIEDGEASYRTVGIPLRIEGAEIRPRGRAPEIGEHGPEVLGELGFTEDEVARLRLQGVLGAQG